MENTLVESRAGMSFHLDGNNEIDAVILSNIISEMAALTSAVSKEVNPDAYLKTNVTAFKNGSFQIDFSAVCKAAETMFSDPAAVVTIAATIIGAVKGCFEIKKMLKGEKEKSVSDNSDGSITITTADGATITAPKASQIVLGNVQAAQNIANVCFYAREHNENKGFTISDKDGGVYCAPADLEKMSTPSLITETVSCQRGRVEALLPIRRPVLEGYSKWGLKYNGKAIDASITDEDFLERFHQSGSVRAGDCLQALMEVYVDVDRNGIPIAGTEKYTIIKVHSISQGEPQT
jgi:hypothetical protein